jgi:hypothetical protein
MMAGFWFVTVTVPVLVDSSTVDRTKILYMMYGDLNKDILDKYSISMVQTGDMMKALNGYLPLI